MDNQTNKFQTFRTLTNFILYVLVIGNGAILNGL